MIEAVVKITERCNINCSYCYVFNKGDDAYVSHPPLMSLETVRRLGLFLSESAKSLQARRVQVDFHGGEPLLMKPDRFTEVCEILRDTIEPTAQLKFCIQTNAMLVDQRWIDCFERFQVSVGVSLDGVQEVNDAVRVDHDGKGTYARTIQGLRSLQAATREGVIPAVGILAVADANASGSVALRHFVEDLGVTNLDFLLPIESHDSFDQRLLPGLGKYLCDVYDEWVRLDDPVVNIRILRGTRSFFSRGREVTTATRGQTKSPNTIITVASDGSLGPDDSVRTACLPLFSTHNIAFTSIAQFLDSPEQKALAESEWMLASACQECCWKNLCKGGAAHGRLINRFSRLNGFNNRSVLCEALMSFYGHVAASELKRGLKFSDLRDSLIDTDANFASYDTDCYFASLERPGKTIPLLQIRSYEDRVPASS